MFQIMTITALVELDGDRAVVVKRATAAEAERLEREGLRLRTARHPGVVEVLHSAAVGDGWELRMTHGGRPLAAVPDLAVPQAAGLIASLASTLADLHQVGIVHGRLDPSHVLVGEQGRPVLCGFGDGSEAAQPDADVAALGALLIALLGSDAELEPIPDRRWRTRRTWRGWERRALLLLADQACAEPATRRPTARRFAAVIAEAVPRVVPGGEPASAVIEAAVIDEGDPIERLRATATVVSPAPALRPPAAVLALLGAGLLLVGVLRFGGGAVHDEAVPLAEVVPTVSTLVPTTASTLVSTSAPVAGSMLAAGGRRYRVGQPGDELLVADWDCDGTPTPALLRPSTSEVFVFPAWVEHGELSVRPVVRVPGGAGLVSDMGSGGCPTLAVRTTDGSLVPVTSTGTS